MKRVFSLVLFLMVFAPAYGANWVEVGKSQTHDIWYVDTSSLDIQDGTARFWLKILFKSYKTVSGKKVWYELHRISAACKTKYYAEEESLFFKTDGGVITRHRPILLDYKNIPPETMIESAFSFVCEGLNGC